MVERRRHKRHSVDLPCRIAWEDGQTSGRISNVSLGGALIVKAEAVPSRRAPVCITFEWEGQRIQLDAEVVFTVDHAKWGAEKELGAGLFSVKFSASIDEVRKTLAPFLEGLATESV